jgi:ABC-type Fe3+-siderophore transport system permease subunit
MDATIFSAMLQFDLVLVALSFILVFFKTSRIEVEYLIRSFCGAIAMILSIMISFWSVNGAAYDTLGMILNGGLSTFFFILGIIMFLYLVFELMTYILEKTYWVLEDQPLYREPEKEGNTLE